MSNTPRSKAGSVRAADLEGRSWADLAPAASRWAVVLLFVAVLVPILLFLHPVGDYFVETDFYGGYAPGVHALWAHGPDPARYGVVGPVYELVLGALGLTGVDLFRVAQFLSLASMAGAIALWASWLDRRVRPGLGWIGALLCATNPTVVRYAYTASTDALALLLASAAFVTMFPRRAELKTLALAGIFAGLATLTRYTGIVLVPLGLAAVLWPGRKSLWNGVRVKALVAFVLGALAVFGPWWGFTLAKGAPPALRFYHNLAYDVFARSKGVTWDDYQTTLEKEFPTFRSVIEKDPGAVARRVAENAFVHAREAAKDLWLPALTALAAIGLAFGIARRIPGTLPPFAFGALYYAALVPAFYAARYHLVLVPPAAALAAIGLAHPRAIPALFGATIAKGATVAKGATGAKAARGGGFARAAASAIAVTALAGALVLQTRATIADTRAIATQVPGELPALGAALRADWKGPDAPRLIARKPHLSYYGHAEPVPFPDLYKLEEFATYAHERQANYVFVSWPEALLRPPFAFLLVPEFAPRGLELVAAAPNGRAALYRVTPELGETMPDWYPQEWPWRAAEGLVRIQPQVADNWLRAGEGRHARGDLPGAREALERALRLRPRWGPALVALANVEAASGDFRAAVPTFEAALAAGETDPTLLRNLGIAAAQMGDLPRAVAALERYLTVANDPEIAGYLAQLRAGAGAAGGGANAPQGGAR
jgi:4-amino-4-deoxy-L-arabinose transferase-like glycosyltransferase